MKFGEKLRQERLKTGLTQEALSAHLGITCRTLQNYESGSVYPKKRELYTKLAEFFHTDVNYWLTETQEPAEIEKSIPHTEARGLVSKASSLFDASAFSEEEMDDFMRILQYAYWDAKDKTKKGESNGDHMDNDKIVILQGPERVRKRPAVIFSSDGIEGVQTAVRILLELFAAEAQLGHCKHLTVRQNGAELEICGDDRGIYLGQGTNDDTIWKSIFCELFPASAYAPDESGYSFGLLDPYHHRLYGEQAEENSIYFPEESGFMELCAIQYASKYMDVCVVRNGIKSVLHFQQGHNVGGIHNEPSTEPNGTRFHLEMDPAVFTHTVLPVSFFVDLFVCQHKLAEASLLTFDMVRILHRTTFNHFIKHLIISLCTKDQLYIMSIGAADDYYDAIEEHLNQVQGEEAP